MLVAGGYFPTAPASKHLKIKTKSGQFFKKKIYENCKTEL